MSDGTKHLLRKHHKLSRAVQQYAQSILILAVGAAVIFSLHQTRLNSRQAQTIDTLQRELIGQNEESLKQRGVWMNRTHQWGESMANRVGHGPPPRPPESDPHVYQYTDELK